VRGAERFAVVAGDDDQRVVRQPAFCQRVDEPADLRVGLADRVEVVAQVPSSSGGARVLEEVDLRRAFGQRIRVMRLLRPRQREERFLCSPRSMMNATAVDHVPVFAAPGEQVRRTERPSRPTARRTRGRTRNFAVFTYSLSPEVMNAVR
jgi:hypothetical protein